MLFYIYILSRICTLCLINVNLSQCFEYCEVLYGVRQGDPIAPKLFSAAIETIFQTVDHDKGLNIDGETLTNLRFADDVALKTNNMTEMEEQLNRLHKNSKNIGLKNAQRKDQVHDKFPKRSGNTHRKRKNRRSHQLQVFRTNNQFKRHHKRRSHLQDSSWMELFRKK